MKISHQDKVLLFEQEMTTLLFILLLGLLFHFMQLNYIFYLTTLIVGFGLYFWMLYEEKIHITGSKQVYFEHTSSYLMIAQTTFALQLVSINIGWKFLTIIFMIAAVIMYSVALSRIILFKLVFKNEKKH